MTTLGETLRQYRRERGLSQERLGKRIGVSHNRISLIEWGVLQPSLDMLRLLADELDVQLGRLWRLRGDGAA